MKSNDVLVLSESDNVLILSDKIIPHLQRLERVLAAELSSLYEYQEHLKKDCAAHYKFSDKESEGGRRHFKLLNARRNDYRSNLETIKNLESTQKEIRRIIRNQ